MRLAVLLLAASLAAPAVAAADFDALAAALSQDRGRVVAPWHLPRAALATVMRAHWRQPDEATLVAAAVAAARSAAVRRPAAPDTELAAAAIDGLLAALDPAAEHIPAADLPRLRGGGVVQGGLGVGLAVRDGRVVVIAPLDGGPAALAGMRPGDVVVAVDGRPLAAASVAEAERRLAGGPGSAVSLTIQRDGAVADTILVRRPAPPATVVRQSFGDVVLLRVPALGPGSLPAVAAALDGLTAAAVVLDLRNTGGNAMLEAIGVADLFLSGGVIATMMPRDAAKARRHRATSRQRAPAVPMVVLINAGTAAAAEVLAAALQDNGRATLVGGRSVGDGLARQLLPLPEGALRLATEQMLRPSGAPLHGQGVSPDVALADDGDPRRFGDPATDPQLARALALLRAP